jgi:putative ABC transport system ATP-binding protein
MGPSGSGKSTLLALLAGLDRPSAGGVTVDGEPIEAMGEDRLALLRRRKIGFVFQSFQLLSNFTATENVMLPWNCSARRRRDARADELLARVGLEGRGHHYPTQLSGGEQQRVALARAFAPDPPVLMADEPTGNLDAENGRIVLDMMLDLRNAHGTTLVLVTHDPRWRSSPTAWSGCGAGRSSTPRPARRARPRRWPPWCRATGAGDEGRALRPPGPARVAPVARAGHPRSAAASPSGSRPWSWWPAWRAGINEGTRSEGRRLLAADLAIEGRRGLPADSTQPSPVSRPNPAGPPARSRAPTCANSSASCCRETDVEPTRGAEGGQCAVPLLRRPAPRPAKAVLGVARARHRRGRAESCSSASARPSATA